MLWADIEIEVADQTDPQDNVMRGHRDRSCRSNGPTETMLWADIEIEVADQTDLQKQCYGRT